MKVFIADDSQVVRKRLVAMLSEVGKVDVVGEAQDGVEARAGILELRPDLVVLDIRMPWGNGIDVLRDIKKTYPDCKVIILTNYPYSQYRRRCMEEGAEYFFDKSGEFERVIEVIKQLANHINGSTASSGD